MPLPVEESDSSSVSSPFSSRARSARALHRGLEARLGRLAHAPSRRVTTAPTGPGQADAQERPEPPRARRAGAGPRRPDHGRTAGEHGERREARACGQAGRRRPSRHAPRRRPTSRAGAPPRATRLCASWRPSEGLHSLVVAAHALARALEAAAHGGLRTQGSSSTAARGRAGARARPEDTVRGPAATRARSGPGAGAGPLAARGERVDAGRGCRPWPAPRVRGRGRGGARSRPRVGDGESVSWPTAEMVGTWTRPGARTTISSLRATGPPGSPRPGHNDHVQAADAVERLDALRHLPGRLRPLHARGKDQPSRLVAPPQHAQDVLYDRARGGGHYPHAAREQAGAACARARTPSFCSFSFSSRRPAATSPAPAAPGLDRDWYSPRGAYSARRRGQHAHAVPGLELRSRWPCANTTALTCAWSSLSEKYHGGVRDAQVWRLAFTHTRTAPSPAPLYALRSCVTVSARLRGLDRRRPAEVDSLLLPVFDSRSGGTGQHVPPRALRLPPMSLAAGMNPAARCPRLVC